MKKFIFVPALLLLLSPMSAIAAVPTAQVLTPEPSDVIPARYFASVGMDAKYVAQSGCKGYAACNILFEQALQYGFEVSNVKVK